MLIATLVTKYWTNVNVYSVVVRKGKLTYAFTKGPSHQMLVHRFYLNRANLKYLCAVGLRLEKPPGMGR